MLDLDPMIALAGLLVGFTVGLTGMGGGALMTPVMVLIFGVEPLAAVSSDLVVSLVMKPVGSAVHLHRGTVNKTLVKWLVLGSVPAAFGGVLVLKAAGSSAEVQAVIKTLLGVILLVASSAIVAKAFLQMRAFARAVALQAAGDEVPEPPPLAVKPVVTLLVGVVGGFIVGMTSVGSGSLIIVALMLIYPTIKSSEVVGTDLVQAVPLVAAAALGHLLFGDVRLGLTASLLVGALPGVFLGARISSRAPQDLIRVALIIVLVVSGLKLLKLSTGATGLVLLGLAVIGPVAWELARASQGLPRRWRGRLLRARTGERRLFAESLSVPGPDSAADAAPRREPPDEA